MALCIALASAVIIGALAAGDSVNATLQRNAAQRLGRITAALKSDRFFRSMLAVDIARETKGHAAPVLSLGATASSSIGRSIAVNAYGVDGRFWACATAPAAVSQLADGEVRINRRAAAMLGVTNGDAIILRIEKPGALPADMPFRSAEDSVIPMTLRVASIAPADVLGDFSLLMGKAAASVFLDIDELGVRTGKAGRANMIVADVPPEAAARAFKKSWRLADADIRSVRYPSARIIELRSERVFIDEVIERAARNADARMAPVIGYFVNGIRYKDRETPYSFAASAHGIASNSIVINRWLADDIHASAGSDVMLSYYAFDAERRLVERSSTFTVSAVIDVNANEENRGLMPDIEGLSDTANCRDWKPGMPVDLKRIRKKDEDYWNRYRGTPKALVSLEAARQMWRNDFGSVTALRFPLQDEQILAARITGTIDPAELGFRFMPVRDAAMKAARGTVDFGQLFLGLGIFIVAAALILAMLIATLAVERRSPETAALRALGFKPARIINMFIIEHAAGIVAGALIGILLGMAYVAIIVYALNSVWYGAVAGTEILISVTVRSIVIGAAVSAAAGIIAMAVVIRRSFSRTIHAAGSSRNVIGKGTYILFAVSGAGLIASLIWGVSGAQRAEAFFSAGTFVLITVLAGLRIIFSIIARDSISPLTVFRLALRQAARKPRASITAAALIACGLFITIAVAANRQDSAADAHKRSSGTGGFSLFIETAIPMAIDLNDAKIQRRIGVSSFSNVSFVPVRVRDGDDASCLNLNRAALPPLYGIHPADFESRGAFTFVGIDSRVAHVVKKQSPWGLLNDTPADGAINGIVDDTVLTWGLAKKLGDVITYQDEHGRPVDVRIVATLASSLLQGGIIVSGRDLAAHFPSSARATMFLVDANAARGEAAQIQEVLSRTLRDYGAAIMTAPDRLMMFSSVEHTYLSIFLSLGAFGLMLGTAGLGIVLLRTLDERRGERALMNAMGFSHRKIIIVNAIEQFFLLTAGVTAGLVSALIAVVPSALSRSLPWTPVLLCVVMVAGAGAIAVIAAVRMSVRPGMIDWLRDE